LRAAPAPGLAAPRSGILGRLVVTSYFFDTGITVTDDHVRHRRILDVPPVEEWGDPEDLLRGEDAP
jgi:hypothetical protein